MAAAAVAAFANGGSSPRTIFEDPRVAMMLPTPFFDGPYPYPRPCGWQFDGGHEILAAAACHYWAIIMP